MGEMQWLELVPHNKKVLGLDRPPRGSLGVIHLFLWVVSSFLSQSNSPRLTGNSKCAGANMTGHLCCLALDLSRVFFPLLVLTPRLLLTQSNLSPLTKQFKPTNLPDCSLSPHMTFESQSLKAITSHIYATGHLRSQS